MRYFIGYIVTIGLLIVLILFLVGSGGSSKKTPMAAPKLLNSYAFTDAQVKLVIDGPINAPQSHQSIQITVGALDTTYTQTQGYDGTVVNSQTFANTENSYFAFLSALMQASFTRGTTVPGFHGDTGLCPLGDRYNFEIIQDGRVIQNNWATTCGGVSSFKGNIPLSLSLFQSQVPGYSLLSSQVAL